MINIKLFVYHEDAFTLQLVDLALYRGGALTPIDLSIRFMAIFPSIR
jgi:hypothetical protein